MSATATLHDARAGQESRVADVPASPAVARVRLRLTGAGRVAAIVTALLLLAGLGRADARLVFLGGTLGGLVAMAAISSRLALRGLAVERRIREAVHAGEPCPYTLAVARAPHLPPARGLTFTERLTAGALAAAPATRPAALAEVSPGAQALVDLTLAPFRRGEAGFAPVLVSAEAPPSLVRAEGELEVPGALLVLPRRAAIGHRILSRVLASAASLEQTSAAAMRGDDEPGGLRPYRAGDPCGRIAWKRLAARPDAPVVRELLDARVRDAEILLDTHVFVRPMVASPAGSGLDEAPPAPGRRPDGRRARAARIERAIVVAVALADALLAGGYRVVVRAFEGGGGTAPPGEAAAGSPWSGAALSPGAGARVPGSSPVPAPRLVEVRLVARAGALEELEEALARLAPQGDHPLADLAAAAPRSGARIVLALEEEPPGLPAGTLVLGPERQRELVRHA